MNKEISGNELCPCGSKKKYKRCCRKKDFTWARDEDGNICRVVSASDELIEQFHKSRKQFFDVFGREPVHDDPLILGSYLISDIDLENDLDQAMEAADINPAIAYACKKTGLLVSQQNVDKFTDLELKEWNYAIAEFNNGSMLETNPITPLISELEANIDHLIFAYGLVLDKYVNKVAPSTGPVEFMIKFHITKSMKILRSIRLLTHNSMPDAAFALLRTMYESYIYLIYAISNPKEAEDMLFATLGLDTGAYRYPLNTDGSVKSKRIAVDVKSGKEVKLTINNYKIIESTKSKSELEFYEMIYELLSKHVHPNVSILDQCFDMHKFDHFISLHKEDGITYANAIASIILEFENKSRNSITNCGDSDECPRCLGTKSCPRCRGTQHLNLNPGRAMVRVKICGITNLADALAVIDAGADALGFVFYEKSPRHVNPMQASAIIAKLPPFVQTVGLFVNEEAERVNWTADFCGLDLVQLHGDEEPEYCQEIRRRVIKAFRVQSIESITPLRKYPVAGYLLDAWCPDCYGGSGKTFNWEVAAAAREFGPVILAGGLTADNVRQAVEQVRPYAVDVSSGVESAPGKKDAQQVREFIRLAKGL